MLNNTTKLKPKTKAGREKEVSQKSKKTLEFLKNNQIFIATLLIMVFLAGLTLFLSWLFSYANDTSGEIENNISINFDKKTIEQIKELNKFDEKAVNSGEGDGRINPFAGK